MCSSVYTKNKEGQTHHWTILSSISFFSRRPSRTTETSIALSSSGSGVSPYALGSVFPRRTSGTSRSRITLGETQALQSFSVGFLCTGRDFKWIEMCFEISEYLFTNASLKSAGSVLFFALCGAKLFWAALQHPLCQSNMWVWRKYRGTIKRGCQVTKSQGVFRGCYCICSGISTSLVDAIRSDVRQLNLMTYQWLIWLGYLFFTNYIEIKIIRLKWQIKTGVTGSENLH